jgi:PAS domain S-box-containing protein
MTTKTNHNYWQIGWDRLTRPAASIKSQDEQQQARLLASLLLMVFILSILTIPVWLWGSPDFVLAPYIGGALAATSALAYGLSRGRSYYAGAVLMILAILVLVAVSLLTAPGPITARMLVLKSLVVAVMIAIIFLRWQFALLLAGICLGIIGFFFFIPEVPFANVYSDLVFFLIFTSLMAVQAILGERYKQQLIASEERYRTVVAALSEGVVLLGQGGVIQTCNPAAEQVLGLTTGQMAGRTLIDPGWQTIHEDGSPYTSETFPASVTLRTGQPLVNVMMGIFTPAGDLRWLSINSQPLIRPDESQPYAVVVSFTDITNLKRQEMALREAEHRYRALFEQSHDAVFILDLEGSYIEANRRTADMLGYTTEEMQVMSMSDLSAEEGESQNMLSRLLAGEHLPVYEQLFRRKNGSLIPVEIKAELVYDAGGQPLHIQSMVRDITKRKAQEQQLHQSEARQRALLSAIPDLMFRTHRDGTFLDYHAGNEERLAVPPEQFLGRKTAEVLPRELAERHMHYIEQVLQTGKQAIYEYAMVLHEQTLHFEARMVPSGTDEVLAIVRDVTEQKRLQAQTVALTLEKERADLLGQFVQNASHELRTPLSIINNDLYLITRVKDEEKRLHYAERSQQQIMRLTHLLDMIFSMTSLDSDIPFTLRKTDINDMIQQLVSGAEGVFSEKGGAIQLIPDPSLSKIRIDEIWLQVAIRHLLDNAIRFTPNGGWIRLRTYRQNGQMAIEINDSGIGISEQALTRIFERFWRQDEAHSTPGFGLGLSIAQKIVEKHNGRIEVESEVGQGSQFRILLPYDANFDS